MDPTRARDLLARERTRVELELARLRPAPGEELSNLDQHPADGATQLFEDERDAGLVERLQEKLTAIASAERRLEEGTYGTSVESGRPIADARLEAIPWAQRTAEEQQRFDRR